MLHQRTDVKPQTENLFNCSRHQHLLTVAFRRCVQTFLLTYTMHMHRLSPSKTSHCDKEARSIKDLTLWQRLVVQTKRIPNDKHTKTPLSHHHERTTANTSRSNVTANSQTKPIIWKQTITRDNWMDKREISHMTLFCKSEDTYKLALQSSKLDGLMSY